jgi:hypothetical protein
MGMVAEPPSIDRRNLQALGVPSGPAGLSRLVGRLGSDQFGRAEARRRSLSASTLVSIPIITTSIPIITTSIPIITTLGIRDDASRGGRGLL